MRQQIRPSPIRAREVLHDDAGHHATLTPFGGQGDAVRWITGIGDWDGDGTRRWCCLLDKIELSLTGLARRRFLIARRIDIEARC